MGEQGGVGRIGLPRRIARSPSPRIDLKYIHDFLFFFLTILPMVPAEVLAMQRASCVLGLAFVLAGCVNPAPERLRAYNEDGVFLFQRGDYFAACESFRAALALQPEDPALLYNTGECYDRMGDVAKAERYYNECLQRDPNHAECRHALTVLLVRVGRRQAAVQMVQEWMAREPKRAAAYAEDGWLWFQAGDLPRAQTRLHQALELDPRDRRALIELARVYETLRRPDRAADLYERLLATDPKQAEVVSRLNLLRAQGAGAPLPD
jgi:Tfp pilus assembly protein PilF